MRLIHCLTGCSLLHTRWHKFVRRHHEALCRQAALKREEFVLSASLRTQGEEQADALAATRFSVLKQKRAFWWIRQEHSFIEVPIYCKPYRQTQVYYAVRLSEGPGF